MLKQVAMSLVAVEIVALLAEIIFALRAVIEHLVGIISFYISILSPSAASIEAFASAVCTTFMLWGNLLQLA